MITAFEIQVLNKGNWRINSIFDDQELATYEANRVFGHGAYDVARVVRENDNESTDTASVRTISQLTRAVVKKVAASRLSDNSIEKAARRAAVQSAETSKDDFNLLWWLDLIARSVGIAVAALMVLFLPRLLYEM